MIVVNFKKVVTGDKAVELCKMCKKVSGETGVKIIAAVQDEDWQIGCWTQKFFKPEIPCLLNHSDYPLTIENLKSQISKLKSDTCICVQDISEGVELAKLSPDYLAYEPHELIGSTEKSVSLERPKSIKELVLSVRSPVLVGAGIHSKEDVQIALALGATGILVSTAIVQADNPENKLRELVNGFKS